MGHRGIGTDVGFEVYRNRSNTISIEQPSSLLEPPSIITVSALRVDRLIEFLLEVKAEILADSDGEPLADLDGHDEAEDADDSGTHE